MSFVENSNLPNKKVTAVLISEDAGEGIFKALKERNIKAIKVSRCEDIAAPVSSHADMLFHSLGGKNIVCSKCADKNVCEKLDNLGFNIITAEKGLKKEYPYDISLNAARIGNKLFCRKEYLDGKIKNYCEKNNVHIIDVKQGYAKCSVCVADDNSIITADKSIEVAAKSLGMDVLMITAGNIKLNGYDTGFIGGCCGKSDKNTMMFCGSLKYHPDYKKIKSFLLERNIAIDNLTDETLFDVGSIIPLIEE